MKVILPFNEPVLIQPDGVVLHPAQEVRIEVDRQEIEDASGASGGPGVLRIRANDEKGVGAYFWVSVKYNRQGRPVVCVSTETTMDKLTTKKIVGTCNRA